MVSYYSVFSQLRTQIRLSQPALNSLLSPMGDAAVAANSLLSPMGDAAVASFTCTSCPHWVDAVPAVLQFLWLEAVALHALYCLVRALFNVPNQYVQHLS